jgi:glycine hydroxymethyltransferase
MGDAIMAAGYGLVTGGTDTHLILADLRPKGLTGKVAEAALGRANITCNKNAVPFDEQKPFITSGIRLGSPAGTSRGFGEAEFQQIGRMIGEVLDGVVTNGEKGNGQIEERVKREAVELCERFPIYN